MASVVGILVFVLAEAWPLFQGARGHALDTLELAAVPAAAVSPAPVAPSAPSAAPVPGAVVVVATPLATGVDEYQMYLYQLRSDGRIAFFRMRDGSFAFDRPVPGVAGVPLVAGSRTLTDDLLAAATVDGRVALMQIRYQPRYEGQKLADLDVTVEERGLVDLQAGGQAVREVSFAEDASGGKAVAALLADGGIAFWGQSAQGEGVRTLLRPEQGESVTCIRLGRTERLIAGTDRGRVYHWDLNAGPRLTSVSPAGSAPVTALQWIIGEITFVAGTEKGEISAWFAVRLHDDDAELSMVRAHVFEPQGGPVVAMGASSRDKSFVTAGRDGGLVLRHLTSERTLLRLQGPADPRDVVLTPRNDALLSIQADGTVGRFVVDNPHPEITWNALFGKVWYEGYGQPEHVWQSTGATSDFEPKFGLVPLVFGTLKATFYALLFAIPLAVLGALYTSHFVHPTVRAKVKPTLEIMAALPSVVIGFVAGLWLASVIEQVIVPVLLMMPLLPLFGTSGVLLWRRLPRTLLRRLKPGMEVALILPLLLLGGWVALQLGPWVEGALFQGDFKMWLSTNLGLTYDQRNSLVVGLAMGFAVIPIIFTISDDAFSSVPSSLTAGSLALGASRWQTALRVVLPTASPGVFSAVMIGFGRAVGETMIVLMATGNTPVLDWSIFNGMRTLSANVAVEIPEAPHGGTLYRVLFLSAALLFLMTFMVNTLAEVIRQRLREKYRAL
ncbi:MAG TPA: ABC transporter permease subunit [Vicinamibacteria bacterium]|nr:ABC transporter permease subunit [Vicinamibacteria bacterium]